LLRRLYGMSCRSAAERGQFIPIASEQAPRLSNARHRFAADGQF
jgi:hypothetical protein